MVEKPPRAPPRMQARAMARRLMPAPPGTGLGYDVERAVCGPRLFRDFYSVMRTAADRADFNISFMAVEIALELLAW